MKLVVQIILSLLIIAVVFSCKSGMSGGGKERTYSPRIKKGRMNASRKDPISIDSLANDKDGVVDYKDIHVDTVTSSYQDTDVAYQLEDKEVKYVIEDRILDSKKVNHEIKDQTIPDSTKGTMAYNIPDDMTVGKHYSVKIRITRDRNGKQQLIVGDDAARPIATTGVKSTITIESIRVESVMSAELVSLDEAFEINTSSTKEQNIEDLGYTEWEWDIKPLKSGEHPLKLLIKVRIINEQGGYYKDIVVFERNVNAKADYMYTLATWGNENWKWLWTTIIVPIFLWWRKRKKEKEKGKEGEQTPTE